MLCAWLNSQLAVGGLCGNVDIFDAYLHKELYQGKFEFTYVTKSRVRRHSNHDPLLTIGSYFNKQKKLIHHHDK